MSDNPLPKFWELLEEAHAAGAEVDDFDLDSADPKSVAVWDDLIAAQARRTTALVDYVLATASLRAALQP